MALHNKLPWQKRGFAILEWVKYIGKYTFVNNFGAKRCSFYPSLASEFPYAFVEFSVNLDNCPTYFTLLILGVYHQCNFWASANSFITCNYSKNSNGRSYVKSEVESSTWIYDGIRDCIGIENVVMLGKCKSIRFYFLPHYLQVVWRIEVIFLQESRASPLVRAFIRFKRFIDLQVIRMCLFASCTDTQWTPKKTF